ncbi:MAG: hypothetical protein ACM3SS_03590 [Rhodospirillaceae bacterium]
MSGLQRRREGRRVELFEDTFRFFEAPDQKQAPDRETPRMRGIHPVAVRFERCPRQIKGLRRPGEVARDQRDLGFGHHAPCAGHRFFRTEGARRTAHERPRSNEIAQLRHRDAAKRERGRIVAEGDAVQRTERIAGRERTRRRRD